MKKKPIYVYDGKQIKGKKVVYKGKFERRWC